MTPFETAIQEACRKRLTKLGAKCIKIHGDSFTEAGTPDIIGCYRGRCFTIETKQDDGILTPIQAYRLMQWKEAGAIIGVARNADEAERIMLGTENIGLAEIEEAMEKL